ncbi:hypothetical protein [Streptomyces montanisoli]|uniref:Uncharacterized protein n=1 Tax=Streptomyces montanisoli TaxID=2798581 RepID=A0A940RV00_9ACTN|nr:hypothetical protein [Streptomyces montanisoli]MBP0457750.1 hypothetical protein [Streptomyces montanisoli]
MEESPVQDVIDALGALRTTGAQPDAGTEQLAADLVRGHRALNRRRRLRIVGAGLTAAVAAAGLTAAVSGPFGGSAPSVAAPRTSAVRASSAPVTGTPRTGSPQTGSPQSSVAAGSLQLAAYTGAQPAGFKVATLPKGWKVRSVSQYDFVAVPPGTPERTMPQGAVYLADGIAVSLQGASRFSAGESLKKVSVRGRTGQLGFTGDKQAKWLIFPSEEGQKVLIQVPVELGLTDSQIVRFAQGVSATGDAKPTGG